MKFSVLLPMIIFTLPAMANIQIFCQGTYDKSLKLEASLDQTQGLLKVEYIKKDQLIQRTEKVSLVSSPEEGAGNYKWATVDRMSDEQYTIAVRPYLIQRKLNGTTEDIELYLKPAFQNMEWGFDMKCEISQ